MYIYMHLYKWAQTSDVNLQANIIQHKNYYSESTLKFAHLCQVTRDETQISGQKRAMVAKAKHG